jgi:hypothetical protein
MWCIAARYHNHRADATVELRRYRKTWSGRRAEVEHIALINLGA